MVKSYGFFGVPTQVPETNMKFPTGAAGMYSTILDMLEWAKAIIENKLIGLESYDIYEKAFCGSYACGWDVTHIKGEKILQHRGDLDGFVTSIKICRKRNIVAILLSNQEIIAVTEITKRIFEILLDDEYTPMNEIAMKPIDLEINKLTGCYEYFDAEGKNNFQITHENDAYYIYQEKRYRILYKFKLKPLLNNHSEMILRLDKIDEYLVLKEGSVVSYKRQDGKEFKIKKTL